MGNWPVQGQRGKKPGASWGLGSKGGFHWTVTHAFLSSATSPHLRAVSNSTPAAQASQDAGLPSAGYAALHAPALCLIIDLEQSWGLGWLFCGCGRRSVLHGLLFYQIADSCTSYVST